MSSASSALPAAAATKTAALVRLWPRESASAVAPSAGTTQGVSTPSPVLFGKLQAAIDASTYQLSRDSKKVFKAALQDAHKLHEVDLGALVLANKTLAEAIGALRAAGWLSPTASDVVVVEEGTPFVFPVGIALSDNLVSETRYVVYEVFSVTPRALYRTVSQDDMYPCVSASLGLFGSVAPIACATFDRSEFDTAASGVVRKVGDRIVISGLSLEGAHRGSFEPDLSSALDRSASSRATVCAAAGAASAGPTAAGPVAASGSATGLGAAALLAHCSACGARTAAAPLPANSPRIVACCCLCAFPDSSLGRSDAFGKLGGPMVHDSAAAAPVKLQIPSRDDEGKETPSYYCFELPKGSNVGVVGCRVVYDNDSSDKLAHFSLIAVGPRVNTAPWKAPGTAGPPALAASQLLVPAGGAAASPPDSLEFFWDYGKIRCPRVAGLFHAHCFMVSGRMDATFFRDDEPGADADIADALDTCANLVLVHDDDIRRLLDATLAARYSLARMSSALLSDLAEAFEDATRLPLSERDAKSVARGTGRLREWASAHSGSILLYASGGSPFAGEALDVPADRFYDLLNKSLRAPRSAQEKFVSVTVDREAQLDCAAADMPPSAPKLLAAARRALAWTAPAASTELVLSGVPLDQLAGVMSDLDDSLTQRVLFACAMLAIGRHSTDTPTFTYGTIMQCDSEAKSSSPLSLASPLCALGAEAESERDRARFCCFIRASAYRRAPADATKAKEAVNKILDDVSLKMWGLSKRHDGRFLDGRFFAVMNERPILPSAPMYPQLLQACRKAAAGPSGGFAIVDGEELIRARPGEVLFVLMTRSRRTFLDAPALVLRMLHGHSFPDAAIGGVVEINE